MTTPAEKVTKLVIDRKKWARGTGGSSLLKADGKMCCLGFYALALGYTHDDILYRSTPNMTVRRHPEEKNLFPSWLLNLRSSYKNDTDACNTLMRDNDCVGDTAACSINSAGFFAVVGVYSESEREAAIAKTFKEAGGVDVEFVG